ncbi:MAG: response regulator [Armatimonadetes bacterium]|nr:response regulator [Armatimonadota bacterium]
MQQARVLIADDESLTRLDLRQTLESLGHTVIGEADNGETALQLARSLRPDVIILDIMMPRKDGLEVAEVVSKERLGAVVMLTAYSDAPMIERATRAGVLAYLVKPFRSEEVLPAIQIALLRYREMNALESALIQAHEQRETDQQVLQAHKILIERFDISEQEAIRRLQAQALASNRSLREVADAILLTADLQLAKKPRKPH